MPTSKKAGEPGRAKAILLSDASSAIAVMASAKEVLGDHHSWEPETVWKTLEEKGIDLSEVNRVKLQAAIALVFVPSFYWDAIVFEKTALAFASSPPNPDALEEASSGQLAWAVEEATNIRQMHGLDHLDFMHEPAAYAAIVMHREGLVLAPTELAFAQDLLDDMNHAADLKAQVKAAWDAIDHEHLRTRSFAETPEDVQLAHLAAIELHVQERDDQAATEMASLRR